MHNQLPESQQVLPPRPRQPDIDDAEQPMPPSSYRSNGAMDRLNTLPLEEATTVSI